MPAPRSARRGAALYASLRLLVDRGDVTSFNVTVEGFGSREPATARVVSRGRAASRSAASDFGALELFGGASIGHTSPWTLMQLLDEELAARDCITSDS